MPITTREKWMAEVVSDAYGVAVNEVLEAIADAPSKKLVEAFFKAGGPAHVFFYYQKPYRIDEETGEVRDSGSDKQLKVTDGSNIKLRGKGVYFVKTNQEKAVNVNGTNDNEVLFGEINENSVTALNTTINQVFKPLVDGLGKSEWGVCEDEQQKDFHSVFDKFASELSEALKSIQGNISLDPYPAEFEDTVKQLFQSSSSKISPEVQKMIDVFQSYFERWSQTIQETLDGADGDRKDNKDAGPKDELDYWKQRMRKLTGISEQLRSKNCRTVHDALTKVASLGPDSGGRPRDSIILQTSRWRSIELRVTEALNEAKDNVKYLQTLEKFIEPLDNGTPESIKEILPALMNSIKMIHTIARYFNTNERMTGLFAKITTSMIRTCKHTIMNFKFTRKGQPPKKGAAPSDDALWEHDNYPPDELLPVFESCIELNRAYQKQYEFTKERLMNMPKGKQFEFSPQQIFGRFDLFCRRIGKLMELFGTIQQFRTLGQHKLENIQPIIENFNKHVTLFKRKNHKLLDFTQNKFDRDFVAFNVSVSMVETELQNYIHNNFEKVMSITDSLKLLRKFKSILHRDNLAGSLNSKYQLLFQNYGREIQKIERHYQDCKNNPPLCRNLPSASGSIAWARHLFNRLAVPMEQFPQDLIKQQNSKRFVKQYNKVGYTLFSYEYLWRQKWVAEVDKAKAGLQATLIIRHPENNKLYVNFDTEIMTLIREAKCLSRIGSIDIPESAKIVLLQEDKFKAYKNELEFVLREYDRIVNKIRPNTKSLLVPHLEDLEYKLRPGMVTLTWTSMNIDGYLAHVHAGLAKLEQLIININDIMENRIENNLKSLSKTVLVNLPQDAQTFTLDEFVEMQEKWIKEESEKLKSKNYEVEGAVEDLIQTICSYQLDQHVEPISAEEIQKLSKYYNWSMYQALLHATKYSLNQMKERICGRRNMPKQILKPFFEVDVKLDQDLNTCTLKPTLDEVQSAINRAASHVLKSTKNVQNWCQKNRPEEERDPFYTWIAKDKEIVKVILLLTGSIQGTRTAILRFLEDFGRFGWLWKDRIDDRLRKFNSTNPQLEEFEAELSNFSAYEADIDAVENSKQIGALNLQNSQVKDGLKKWITQWKTSYAKDLHKKASNMIEKFQDDMKHIKLKIEKPAVDIDSLGNVMSALEEIRVKESQIEIDFRPVIDMYRLLEIYIPDIMEKEEVDPQAILDRDWYSLIRQAGTVRDELQGRQAHFKKDLIIGIQGLSSDVLDFRKNFEVNGPAIPGIAPREALNRLREFSDEYSIRKRRFDSFNAGETLFGLPNKKYPELTETEKQLKLLEQLYSLYQKVNDTIARWKDQPWSTIDEEFSIAMDGAIEGFASDCKKLPGILKQWEAYKDLKKMIEDMQVIIPLVVAMTNDAIMPRHWDEVNELTKAEIPHGQDHFTLQLFLDAPILDFQEEIEEIADSAVKQLKLEKTLNGEIGAYWDQEELAIVKWNNVDAPCRIGGNITETQEKLDEHIMTLNQMAALRYVTPFKAEVNFKIGELALVQETLEKWIIIQNLWSNLFPVFKSGDISKQLPQAAKKFNNIDKQWMKLMERASDQKNAIKCCKDDILLQSLPILQEELRYCEKQLGSYLEGKMNKFPRFYFVAEADLLKILSVGSDPNAVQDDFEKLFDAINRVSFDEQDKTLITEITQIMGKTSETVQLHEPVRAEGNIEDYLIRLEKEMQRSVKTIAQAGCQDCVNMKTKDFVLSYQSQIALAGLQMLWNTKVSECLEKSAKEKVAELTKKGKDIKAMMDDLTSMCLDSSLDKLQRMKVETCVTIHVRQREIFMEILDLAKKHLIKDTNDFEWQRQTRVIWNPESCNLEISITDVTFTYQYEFLGAKERLCITPLTDKCYCTLAQALGMNYGGAPAGPAGTGKTETVKDLGRTLGINVVVTNCAPEHKFRDMAKIFKGVAQSGLWGCFDEFNRITLPTLSVVAAQVASINNAKKAGVTRFMFPGEKDPITLIPACGYFITMNPGYAGRQELPENLKVLFRGVCMMIPDRIVIIKVKLASQGYQLYEMLALKFHVLYKLCEQQLSKTRHYDFGLRNILSVLRTAGNSLRQELQGDEEMIMCRTLRDMNLSKFIAQDIPLFKSLLDDIFPRVKNIKTMIYKEVETEIRAYIKTNQLDDRPDWFLKIIQLHETSMVRHGFMLVGAVGSGKTTIMKALTEARSKVANDIVTGSKTSYRITKMNPKAITAEEMYGVVNPISNEWLSGVFAEIWKRCNDKKNKAHNWINCDGPVDALWIENLNTVLDDNKILTLANNERIPMSDLCKISFEVADLNNASPATVSRCGIVFVSPTNLGWEPLINTWSKDRVKFKGDTEGRGPCNPEEGTWMQEFTKKYILNRDLFKQLAADYQNIFDVPEVVRITMFLNLMSGVLIQWVLSSTPIDKATFERYFVYCLSWALAGLCEQEDREKFHKYLEGCNAPLPQIQQRQLSTEKETIFDYFIEEKEGTKQWKLWEADPWHAPKKLNFSQLLIPTSDSTRAIYIIKKISNLPSIKHEGRNEFNIQNSLLIGSPGTAKTSVILMYAESFDPAKETFKRINFSNASQPINFQDNIESEIEKKQVKTYQPSGGKVMHVFVDDVSMPAKNKQGDQVTLEIVRQLVEQRGMYFLVREERGNFREIINCKFLAAMIHPGGGRNSIPDRLKRHFFSMNMTPPSQKAVINIYGQILTAAFNPKKYNPEVVQMKELLIESSIEIWSQIRKRLLPTPTKFHYTFTIRELSRVFQGICQVALKPEFEVIKLCKNVKEKMKPELFLITLWRHECERVFNDKLVNLQDKKVFMEYLDRVTKDVFRDRLNIDDEFLITHNAFAIFQRDDIYDEYGEMIEEAPLVYEACPDIDSIRLRAEKKLEAYNERNPSKKMNLVLFDDALGHLLRITRIINMPSGNALLVGVGGSGKQSMTKLSAFICKYIFFQISLTKTYNDNNLKDDIRQLYTFAGPKGQQVAFIMTDAEVKKESFLEALNSMLATGEIPGLIPKEDKDVIALECKNIWMKEAGSKGADPSTSELWVYFLKRVKDCLHMILAFSPVGTKFRERAQKFPSLFSQCNIDWFLQWPAEALVAVSSKFLTGFEMDATDDVKKALESHMGNCHDLVTEMTITYYQRMRRQVYVTPKSYLSFIDLYKAIYKKRFDLIDIEDQNIAKGLEALREAGDAIAELGVALQKEDAELKEASAATDKLLHNLNIESKKAKEKADAVNETTIALGKDKEIVLSQKLEAEEELAKALPYLRRAEGAVEAIKKKDVDMMGKSTSPAPITKLVMDAIQILFYKELDVPCKIKVFTVAKRDFTFAADSYETQTLKTLQRGLMENIQNFSKNDRGDITPEQVELLEPFVTLRFDKEDDVTANFPLVFSEKWADFASKALVGMCIWASAMRDFHLASKIVTPKMKFLEVKEGELRDAEDKLKKSEAELQEIEQLKARLKAKLDASMKEKQALEDKAAKTKKKMDQATRLINSLKDNKDRWIKNAAEFKSLKKRLTGDVAKACAFVSYCGPFNSEFRAKLLDESFHADIEEKQIPVSGDMQVTSFFVDHTILGQWALEGLPADDLSIQNGVMVTRSSRYPLMIDPQGQAFGWIVRREPELKQYNLITTLSNPRLRDDLKLPLEDGLPVLIEAVEHEVDPMLDPILEKQIIQKGRSKKLIKLGDQEMDYNDKFRIYLTSRLANPHWSPELAAKSTIIDFTVTQGGLEQQLLSRLIGKEQRQLEEQLDQLQKEVVTNKAVLQNLEDQLLERLASVEGSLLDDVELIDVLANIKTKSKEVTEKLAEAADKTIDINEKRELFRPVAARGAVLYFCIVEMANVQWMYNTSLGQFLGLFDYSIDYSEKAQIIKDRVANIVNLLTMRTYRYINRGLFERDRNTFKIMMCTRIMIKAKQLNLGDVVLFLKAGQLADDKSKLFNWMQNDTWLNLKALAKHKFPSDTQAFFKALPDQIQRNEAAWKKWIIDENEPESCPIPDGYEEKLQSDAVLGRFQHMSLVRCLREDRTLIASEMYIADTLGPEYIEPVTDTIAEIWGESLPNRPVLFLLSAGADPTGMIDELARKKKLPQPAQVSMGEGQEKEAQTKIDAGFISGNWVILNNCHLALEYMADLEVILNPKDKEIHPDFRLFISAEPSKDFPLGLLQMAVKVTTEPPSGMKAGLSRTFNTMINQDFLEKVEPYDKWRSITFTLCFMHSCVQERRKFGALGFSKPYEFNTSDLEASLSYCEGHMNRQASFNQPYSFNAMRFMISKVQYGGRITELEDQHIFDAYTQLWITEACMTQNYCFNNQITDYFMYAIPDALEHSRLLEYISKMPGKDIPPIFGLHSNADLTFRKQESVAMINVLVETMPKDQGGGSGKSLEQEVQEKVEQDYMKMMPEDINWMEVTDLLKIRKGARGLGEPGRYEMVPLNVFLGQELQRMKVVMGIVKGTFTSIVEAIAGNIIMTPQIVDAISAVAELRVPQNWLYDPSGAEISWLSPSLTGWIKGLIDRHHQLWQWIQKERPPSFWLTGFFNATGFLTCMKQEVTRQKKAQQWSLDEVEFTSEVLREFVQGDDGRLDGKNINAPGEGVLIHGLYLEGAGWNKAEKRLDDSQPKVLYEVFPILHVSAVSIGLPPDARANAVNPARQQLAALEFSHYHCPVYRYPMRRMPYLIFNVHLKADSNQPQAGASKQVKPLIKWRLCGTALLCAKA